MNRRTLTLSVLGLTVTAASLARSADPDPYANLPSQLSLAGTVRDFRARTDAGGHTDFEWQPTGGYAHYVGQVADALDSEGLPQFASAGYKVTTEWRDLAGNNIINPRSYIN